MLLLPIGIKMMLLLVIILRIDRVDMMGNSKRKIPEVINSLTATGKEHIKVVLQETL